MGFFDLFRPKWKHSNADVRAEAVRQLGQDDAAILAQIVKADSDVRVRRLALKKIADPALLGDLAEHDPDEGLRKDAAEKASDLLLSTVIGEGNQQASLTALARITAERTLVEVARRAALAEVRLAAVARLHGQKALAEVTRKSSDAAVRLAAVDKLDELAALREVAIGDAAKEVALAALGKITDPKALEQIAGKSKQKTVKKAAKDRLDAQHAAATPADGLTPPKRRAEKALLCRVVEEAAASDDWTHAQAACDSARASWAKLGEGSGDESLDRRFERALTKYTLRKEEHTSRQKALAEREVQRKAKAEAEAAQKHGADRAGHHEDEALRAIVEAAKPGASAEDEAERAARLEARRTREAEQKARDEERVRERAEAKARRESEAKENLARLEDVTARLESLAATLESVEKKTIDAALKRAKEVVSAVRDWPAEAAPARARYDKARAALVARSEELRQADDWKRWANVPKFDALCVQMEALITKEDVSQLAQELKTLQAAWKAAGAIPKDKGDALWKRFKTASDLVYERVKAKRATSDEDRAKNQEKKEQLCARAEELAAQPDDSINFKETAEAIKALQDEWKATGQVTTKELSDALWQRFRAACDKFFERRKGHFAERDEAKEGNIKRLEELCAKAESLSGSSDWKPAADLLKQYQADWKEVGRVPGDLSEALWTRFRAACDKFFERRKAHFAELDDEREHNLTAKTALCEEAEKLAELDDIDAAQREAKRLNSAWKAIGPVPKDKSDALWTRFRGACDKVFDRDRMPAPEELAPPTGDNIGIGRFENKLPLDEVRKKLEAKQPEPVAEKQPEPVVAKKPEPVVEAKQPDAEPSLIPLLADSAALDAAASEWDEVITETNRTLLADVLAKTDPPKP